MADDNDTQERESTTLTYTAGTREFLFNAYPDAINIQEAIRSAISDARLVRERGLVIDDDQTDITDESAESDSP